MTVSRTNLCTNPSFEVGVGGWSVVGSGTLTQTSVYGVTRGSFCGQMDGFGSAAHTVPCAAGLYVTAGFELTAPAAGVCSVVWLTAASAVISTVAVPGVSVTGRTVATVGPAPAATASAKLVVSGAGNGAWWLDAVTIETSASSAGTPGTYFDGDSAPSASAAVATSYVWTGAVGASISQQLATVTAAPPMLAGWPTLAVDTWPGVNPSGGGAMPTTPPTDLSGRTQQIKITRGRQYEMAQDSAGQCDLTIDSSDGAVSPERGFRPLTPMQVVATYQGVAHPLFTGFSERWPWQEPTPARRTATVTSSDILSATSSVQISSPTTQLIAGRKPNLYWPLTDGWSPVNTLPNQGTAGAGYSCTIVANPNIVGPTPGGLGKTGVVDGDPATGFEVDLTSTGAHGPGHEGIFFPTSPVDMTKPWMVGCLFRVNQLNSGPVPILTLWNTAGTKVLISLFLWSTHELGVQTWPAGLTPGDTTTTPTLNTFMSNAILQTGSCGIVLGWDGSSLTLTIAPPEAATLGESMTFVGLEAWSATPGFVSVGYPRISGTAWTGQTAWGNQNIQIGHVMLFDHYDLGGAPNRTGDGFWSAVTAYGEDGQHPGARIADLATMAGITAPVSADDGVMPLGRYSLQATTAVVDQIRQAATTDSVGRVFVDGAGTLTYQDRWHYPDMSWNLGVGGLPYTGSPDWQFDPTYIYNDIQLSNTDIGSARSTDQASQTAYLTRTLTSTPNLEYNSDLQILADGLLARYKSPAVRVGQITLDPSANPALWPMVLGIELGHEVIVRHKTATGTRVFYGLVDSITHTIDASASTWTTQLQLSPEWPMWRAAIMHTTLAQAAAAGDTTIVVGATPDAAFNGPQASLGGASRLIIDGGSANIASVSADSPGWSTATVTLTAPLSHPHPAGAVVREPITIYEPAADLNTVTFFDATSMPGQSTVPTF